LLKDIKLKQTEKEEKHRKMADIGAGGSQRRYRFFFGS
jgi:hypothetical protein